RCLAGVAASGYHNGVPLPAHCAGMDKQPILRVCSNMQIQIGFEMVEKILNAFRSTQSRVITIEHAEMPHIAAADKGRHYGVQPINPRRLQPNPASGDTRQYRIENQRITHTKSNTHDEI